MARSLRIMSIVCACVLLGGSTDAASVKSDEACEMSKVPFFIPDSVFCDLFKICEKGVAVPGECDDGLVFDIEKSKCDMPHTVDCGNRTRIQDSKPTLNCPRRNGMFPVEGTCNQFYHCTDGLHTLITCPPGVIFDPKVGACVHADQAHRVNCSASTVLDFVCPNVNHRFRPLRFGDHDRLSHPTDCRMFYMCLLTGEPRLGGCTLGSVFNPKNGRCDKPKNVPGCETYYGEDDEDEDDDEVVTVKPKRNRTTTTTAASASTARPAETDQAVEVFSLGTAGVIPHRLPFSSRNRITS